MRLIQSKNVLYICCFTTSRKSAFHLILQQTEVLLAWKEGAAESTQGLFYMLPVSRIKGDWISSGTFTLNTSQFQTQEHDVTGKQLCKIGASDSIFQTESVVY